MASSQVLLVLNICLLCTFVIALPDFRHGRPRGGLLGRPAGKWSGKLPPDQWFPQILNHFDNSDTRIWKQRYFVNDTFYKPGGPVFLMIGGEGTADPTWMVMGQWIQYAHKFNALCLMLEHRFYGKSHPTEDLSTESLRFLSSEQALADLANFRTVMTDKMKLGSSKWIAFGGSYPGSLAAWVRLKYPHLIHGSVATSAPIFAQLNFKEYMGVVRDSLATTGADCNKNIQAATTKLSEMLRTSAGAKQVKALFQLCDDIDIKNTNDVANLLETLAGNFAGVVQYNKDNRKFEGAKGTNITVDTVCEIMNDHAQPDPLKRYANVNFVLLKAYGQDCVDFTYSKMIKGMQQTSWASSAGEGGRQWMYQTCTEFGYYQTSDLQNQPFGHGFPIKFMAQQCKDIYGAKFTPSLIQAGINRTNVNYGGYGMKVTKVVFPNGSIDPWHALGITKDLNPEATAIYITGTAHCANMYPDSQSDLPQLKQARIQIQKLIAQWLNQ